jgi:hypothetical protein
MIKAFISQDIMEEIAKSYLLSFVNITPCGAT